MARVCDEYADMPAFINGITERIWEGRDLDLIRATYGEHVLMHTARGDIAGVERVVANTLETLHAFPDRKLLGEDVIWTGVGAAEGYSSHRIASTQTHLGDGPFGPATRRAAQARTIADCLVRDGRIVEEWLVRDQAAIVAQLGLDIADFSARAAAAAGGALPEISPPTVPARGEGEGARVAAAMDAIWNRARLCEIADLYDRAVQTHLPGGRTVSGRNGVDAFLVGYLAAFPGAKWTVEHVITRTDSGRPVRVALRWKLVGTHSGHGAFGPPSGAAVTIPGITHAELADGRIVREFVLVDELAMWTAAAAARG